MALIPLSPPFQDKAVNTNRDFSQSWTRHQQDIADNMDAVGSQLAAQAAQLTTLAAGHGVTDGSDATAGTVGEYLTASRAIGTPVALGSGTPADVVSLSLTAGDWEVWGTLGFVPAGGTVTRIIEAWVNTEAVTQPSDGMLQIIQFSATGATLGGLQILLAPPRRMSLAAPGTAYLSGMASFTTAAMGAYGIIAARRMR